jgi:transcriptional regulator with XRE-family HTH domain
MLAATIRRSRRRAPLMARKLILSRQDLGWSQVELARRAVVRPETIHRIEQARRPPSLATFDKLYRVWAEREAQAARAGRWQTQSTQVNSKYTDGATMLTGA